jgi:hypothetical protein
MPPHRFEKGRKRVGGRVKGTPNRISLEARALASALVTSPTYQARLIRDFDRRKVHPTIESLIWQYHIGKPVQPVAMAMVNMDRRLEEERRAFQALDLHDLEQLAAESQALVDRAFELAKTANGGRMPADHPLDVVVQSVPANGRAGNPHDLGESDNGSSDNPEVILADPRNSHGDKD